MSQQNEVDRRGGRGGGVNRAGARMLIATAKNRKGGKREGRDKFFSTLLVSPSPIRWRAKGGGWAGGGGKEAFNKPARGAWKICLQIWFLERGRLQSQKIRVELQVCGQNYICAGLAWLARLAE